MTDTTVRPDFRFLFRHPAHFIAFGGGAGLAPVAPGTFGTLLALPIFHWLSPQIEPWSFLVLVVALFWIGVWASAVTGRALGAADQAPSTGVNFFFIVIPRSLNTHETKVTCVLIFKGTGVDFFSITILRSL